MSCFSSLSVHFAFALLSFVALSADGQPADDCRCKGAGHLHGLCGYHIHFGSNENMPWCRTVNKCGRSSIRGSWYYCDERGVERRYASDGQLYNAKQFQTYFGPGAAENWKAAKLFVERRVEEDTRAYSVAEMRAHYVCSWGEKGWLFYWENAAPEQRKAADGKWYGFWDFIKYDPSNGWRQWAESSGTSGALVTGEEGSKLTVTVAPDSGCQCFGKSLNKGHCGYHFGFWSKGDMPWCRTLSSCGQHSLLGSWDYCALEAVERRRITTAQLQGSLHTTKDLRMINPSESSKLWKDAKPFTERRMLGGQAYDVHELRAYYVDALGEKGWLEKWRLAHAEQREADEGKWYTWEQFVSYHGYDKAVQMWDPKYGRTMEL